MNPFQEQSKEQYARIEELFASAMELDPDSRGAFIEEACSDDTVLHEQLQAMLREVSPSIEAADAFSDRRIDHERECLNDMLEPGSANPLPELRPGQHLATAGWTSISAEPDPLSALSHDDNLSTVGPFRLQRRIASGGMGTVYSAQQDDPKRTVALKMIHHHVAAPSLVKRFQRESEILGRLQHPGIARIYKAGVTGSSLSTHGSELPYFAMEFIQGKSLTKHCDQQDLDDSQRLKLLASICDAVQYAHDQDVIHRDLKPDNILVNEDGRPKILDFGIGRMLGDAADSAVTMTQEGQVLGTLAYMAPEQMDGAKDVTPAADVYALGVIGFELLARRLPHDLSGKTTADSLRYLAQNDPPKLGCIDRRFRGDVQTMIDKALQREPQRRYAYPAELAADIRRFLAHEPINARPPSIGYVTRKFIRRHRLLVASVTAIFVLLVGGITGTTLANMATNKTLSELSVTDYQGEQLSLDPATMGLSILDEFLDRYRSLLQSRQFNPSYVDEATTKFEKALARVNFTTYASTMLEENILEQSLDSIHEYFADQPVVKAPLLTAMANTFHELGLADRAHETHLEAVRINREVLGDEHEQTIHSLAHLLLSSWDWSTPYEEMQEYHDLAIAGLTRIHGADHELTLLAQARSLSRKRVYGVGDYNYEEMAALLGCAEAALGPDHEVTIELHRYVPFRSRGFDSELNSRIALYERSRRVFGAKHEQTLYSLRKLGEKYFQLGRWTEAEEVCSQVVDETAVRHGERHPEAVQSLSTLATLLEIRGRLDESETLFKQVVERDRIGLVIPRSNYAFLLYRLGRLDEAEAMMREAREFATRPDEAATVNVNLALILAENSKAEEAESLARLTLSEVRKFDSRKHLLAITRGHLGRALYQQGRYKEAEEELLAAYDGQVALDDVGHDRAERIAGFLVDLYNDWHAEDPEGGHQDKAKRWRGKLEENEADTVDEGEGMGREGEGEDYGG